MRDADVGELLVRGADGGGLPVRVGGGTVGVRVASGAEDVGPGVAVGVRVAVGGGLVLDALGAGGTIAGSAYGTCSGSIRTYARACTTAGTTSSKATAGATPSNRARWNRALSPHMEATVPQRHRSGSYQPFDGECASDLPPGGFVSAK